MGKQKINGGRCRHMAQDAEKIRRVCWGEGVDDVQVDGILRRERTWEVGETESDMMTKGY